MKIKTTSRQHFSFISLAKTQKFTTQSVDVALGNRHFPALPVGETQQSNSQKRDRETASTVIQASPCSPALRLWRGCPSPVLPHMSNTSVLPDSLRHPLTRRVSFSGGLSAQRKFSTEGHRGETLKTVHRRITYEICKKTRACPSRSTVCAQSTLLSFML